jgi:hypothetical protein
MCIVYWGNAQPISSGYSYKSVNAQAYWRFNYENDVFMASDEYYTQGLNFEVVAPELQKFPFSWALIKPGKTYNAFGIGLQHYGYTPSSISEGYILYNDHPYAGVLQFQNFCTAIDAASQQRLTTTIQIGVIGPVAQAAEMQTGIHRVLNNVHPEGWHNQVRNQLAIGYSFNYEKKLLGIGNHFMWDAGTNLTVGTVWDKVGFGSTVMVGWFISPYNAAGNAPKVEVYLYAHPAVDVIGYDGTLQGGLSRNDDPYTLSGKQVEHAVFSNRIGLTANYHRVILEYFQTTATRSFTAGKPHSWGGIQFALKL